MKKNIKNCIFMLKYIAKYSPMRIVVSIISAIGNSFYDIVVNVILFQYVFNSIQIQREINDIIETILLIFLISVALGAFFRWKNNIFNPISNLKINRGIQIEIFKKAMAVDALKYDDPNFYNIYIWISKEADSRALGVLDTFSSLISSILSSAGLVYSAILIDPVILALIIVPIILNLLFGFIKNKIAIVNDREMNILSRRTDYVKRIFYNKKYAQELKIYPIKTLFTKDYSLNMSKMKVIIDKYGWKTAIYSILQQFVNNLFLNFMQSMYVFYQIVVKKAFQVGEYVALVNISNILTSRLTSIFNILPEIQQHSLYIDNYREFLEYEPQIKKNPNGILVDNNLSCDIRLKDVWFRYPSQSGFVLKNINIHIHKGEKVAFVGHNGAGKTTLLKVIMHLYEPTSGQVFLDGRSADEYNLSSYYSNFGVVFQNYQLYAISVKDNIAMGNKYDEERIWDAIDKSGLKDKIQEIDNGIDTCVTKEFDEHGIEFSGGESQKIALARAYAADAGIIILDEPSSALDPIAEEEMHNNILSLTHNKTVIMISHRLSTTKYADKIYYFENGEIVEQGSHDELIEANGNYARMFRLQSQKYAE